MRTKDSGTVTTVVAVDPARAFEVFTKEIGAWWRREPRYRFHPEKNGVMRFEPGTGGCLVEVHDPDTGQGFEVGRVLVWEPGHRLVFEFRGRDSAPGERTEVEVRFAPSGTGTRIVLEHRGWSALRPDHPARRGYSGPAFTDMIGLQWPTAPGHDGGDAAASRARCTEGGGGFMKTWLVLFPPALSAPAITQEPPASPDPQVGRTAQLLLGRGSGEMTANVPGSPPHTFPWTIDCRPGRRPGRFLLIAGQRFHRPAHPGVPPRLCARGRLRSLHVRHVDGRGPRSPWALDRRADAGVRAAAGRTDGADRHRDAALDLPDARRFRSTSSVTMPDGASMRFDLAARRE
jgi:uncharacterized protein YndB with AHSA1/START domain